MNLYGSAETGRAVINYVNSFYFIAVVLLTASLINLAMKALFFSLYETHHAAFLIARIKQLGKTKRLRGLIRE